MQNQKQTASGGTSIFTILFVVFLVLKLTGTIDWSWWLVTAPLWAPVLFIIGVLIGAGIVFAIIYGIKAIFRARRRRKYEKLLKAQMQKR
jgi:uncharacterized protein (DUF983 family)